MCIQEGLRVVVEVVEIRTEGSSGKIFHKERSRKFLVDAVE